MKPFFARNIGNQGRLVRGLGALGLFIGAWFAFGVATWLGIVLLAFGGFALFEALRGWCGLRACGIKTRF
jgi:hypothetical protein